ncbi:MAG: hypothetical protein J6W76_06715 [Spirochaetales bacterium]|nr:hypothetical protein [Spirochaetales bacterium]
MAFTKQKFISLSPLNQKKKLAFAVLEYLDGRQPLEYVQTMLSWMNINEMPANNREWQLLHQRLVQDIEESGQNVDIRLFDGTANKTGAGIIVLDNIRAPYNVGGIMRSAEAFGASKVIMCGITPTTDNAKVLRSAMNVPIETKYFEQTLDAVRHYREHDYYIIAIEKTKTSLDISNLGELPPINKRVLVLGNEEFGVSEEVLSSSDIVAHIPLSGSKNSLNVCTAAGIAMYCLLGK